MKTDKEIDDYYQQHIEFYGDNWGAGFENTIYFRQMIEQARFYVSRHAGSPQADEWLEKYQKLVDIENDV
jgi:hypothetical protein